jgi:hypothetical protein
MLPITFRLHGEKGLAVQHASHRDPLPSSGGAAAELSERDAAILAFERRWWRHAGAKEQAIRDDFGLSAARYYQLLGALIDTPAALAHDPMLVKRLHRMRDARLAARTARRLTSTE